MKELETLSAALQVQSGYPNLLSFDLDDTLTTDGKLLSEVVQRFEQIQAAGARIVIVTGRAAGWADSLIKLLPIDGVVAENGSVLYFWKNGRAKKSNREEPARLYWTSAGYLADFNAEDLKSKATSVLTACQRVYPQLKWASDQKFRLYDWAIDFAEEVSEPLSYAQAQRIVEEFKNFGAQAKVSSIHVNGWWGDFSKARGLAYLVETKWNLKMSDVAYCGDSPNDGPLFEVVPLSIGVANIRDFVGSVDFVLPGWITKARGARGAVEWMDLWLECRLKRP